MIDIFALIFVAQALIIAHRMLWTVMCETALKAVSDGERDALNQVCAHLLRGFQDLIVGMAKLRGEPTTQNQAFLALEALITLESHHINVVQAMLAAPVVSGTVLCNVTALLFHHSCVLGAGDARGRFRVAEKLPLLFRVQE